jgi:hypothetical protein
MTTPKTRVSLQRGAWKSLRAKTGSDMNYADGRILMKACVALSDAFLGSADQLEGRSLSIAELVRYKEAGADFNFSDAQHHLTALMHVCANDRSLSIGKLQVFQRAGADFNARADDHCGGWTALMFMCRNDKLLSLEKLQLFRETRADFDRKDQWGNTALMHLCKANSSAMSVELLALFRDVGADFGCKDKDGRSALMFMCHHDKSLSAEKLLVFREAGANFNARDCWSQTALKLMCQSDHLSVGVLEIFKDAGAHDYDCMVLMGMLDRQHPGTPPAECRILPADWGAKRPRPAASQLDARRKQLAAEYAARQMKRRCIDVCKARQAHASEDEDEAAAGARPSEAGEQVTATAPVTTRPEDCTRCCATGCETEPKLLRQDARAWRFVRSDRVICKLTNGWAPGTVAALDEADAEDKRAPSLPYVVKLDPPVNRFVAVPEDNSGYVLPEVCFGSLSDATLFTLDCLPRNKDGTLAPRPNLHFRFALQHRVACLVEDGTGHRAVWKPGNVAQLWAGAAGGGWPGGAAAAYAVELDCGDRVLVHRDEHRLIRGLSFQSEGPYVNGAQRFTKRQCCGSSDGSWEAIDHQTLRTRSCPGPGAKIGSDSDCE